MAASLERELWQLVWRESYGSRELWQLAGMRIDSI